MVAAVISLGLVALFAWLAHDKHIDVLSPAGEIATGQKRLLVFALVLSAIVVIPVFTMLIFFSVRYRAGSKKTNYSPEWGENVLLESLWWGIPIFIIGILGVVAYQTAHTMDPSRQLSGSDPLTVQVIALQWKWLFLYPGEDIATLNYVPIPKDRPVTFKLTADAPMSAFWIPALGSQIYAMDGMASTLNLKATTLGSYTGYSTNINGKGYAKMTFTADVMPAGNFDKWAAETSSNADSFTMKTYDSLIQPKSDATKRRYALKDASVFDQVLNKYDRDSMHMNMNHAMEHGV
jgi:cytochrome o ubiquinol oxidase subunit 2